MSLKRYDVRTIALSDEQEREIGASLGEGALIIYPTDTLYAIGCCALDASAVGRLRAAKGREADKALPVIVADIVQARSLSSVWPEEAQRLAEAFWPGPFTLVVPAAPALPRELLAGAGTVALRVPGSEVARTLARRAGPLVATSANLAGEAPCLTVDLAASVFPQATLAIDIGPLDGEPSTIVDVSRPHAGASILREGRVGRRAIERALARTTPDGFQGVALPSTH